MEEARKDERNEIIFPRLECLVIKDLVKLSRFCSGNYIKFPSLKKLEIEECPQFKAFVLTSMKTNSEETRPFFMEKVALPNVEEMVISGMDNLKMIWNNQLLEHSFQKLNLMEINNCDKLLSIFPSNMFETFWQLESLTVTACGSLVEISDLQRLNFQERHSKAQLKELYIHGLPKVTQVLKKDPQVMLSFPKLKKVRISDVRI
ncbi:uncharacterized protein LOC116121002 [Pistacia vera]|uniref:uncharacterized protein LOC116121002 n=1 Tax=Pistacia vera TaxID=55513 RepID=UPI001262DB68|nr:uncharacterized protein LOC116121002 [Pistacia vera]